MSTTLIFILFAFVLLLSFAYFALRHSREVHELEGAFAAIRSLDIESFRNLVDPNEEDFLRARLSPRRFRAIKRKRIRAALTYVDALSAASLQFARFGGVARRSSDPAIAASGRQIANSATYLRLRTLEATVSLTVSAAIPGLGPRPLSSLLDQYDRATYLLQNHSTLQRARSQAS
jgi:hypothetical protein